jgi:hypothetical protein
MPDRENTFVVKVGMLSPLLHGVLVLGRKLSGHLSKCHWQREVPRASRVCLRLWLFWEGAREGYVLVSLGAGCVFCGPFPYLLP